MSFNYINSHTTYEFKIKEVKKKVYKPEYYSCKKNAAPCFGTFFRNSNNLCEYDGEIDIFIGLDKNKTINIGINNFMLLTMEQFEKYMSELNKVVPFTYTTYEVKNGMNIHVDLLNANHFSYKWLVSSIRNVYEYPSSFAIKEAFSLIENGFIKDDILIDNIINVSNLILRSMVHCLNDQIVAEYSYTESPGFLSIADLTFKLQKCNNYSRLNDLYPKIKSNSSLNNVIGLNNYFRDQLTDDFDDFQDIKNVEARYNLMYKQIYNFIKCHQK